jgi:hypothetical protein
MPNGCGYTRFLTDHTVKARHPLNVCLYLSWHDPGSRTASAPYRGAGRPARPIEKGAGGGDTHLIMRVATLVSWLVTASLGGFMLHTWLARGGLHRARAAAGGLPPQLIFGHAAAALTGLGIWTAFLASALRPLAWAAVGLLMAAIGLGLCTVTLWTPYPARRPRAAADHPHEEWPYRRGQGTGAGWPAGHRPAGAGTAGGPAEPDDAPVIEVTDEMIARLLAEPVRAPRPRPVRPDPAVLVPVAHGFAAIGTFALAVMSAIR